MRITYAPRDILQIDDARIIYRNFAGRGDKYNREGDRNFAVLIPDEELANELAEKGWKVKIKPPREEGDVPFMFLPVKVKFNDRGPNVYLQTGDRRNRLNEESIGCLDNIDIVDVDLDIRPYDWIIQEGTKNEKSGRSAYLQNILVIQDVDRFAERFASEEYPED